MNANNESPAALLPDHAKARAYDKYMSELERLQAERPRDSLSLQAGAVLLDHYAKEFASTATDASERREQACRAYERHFMKHAMPMLSAPSCFTCGKPWTTDAGAIQHLELPNIYACGECVAAIRASESRGSVPDGWALVPKVPTKEMLDAACASQDRGDWIGGFYFLRAWPHMLAAAPTPPAVSNGEPTAEQWKEAARYYNAPVHLIEKMATELARSAAAKGEG